VPERPAPADAGVAGTALSVAQLSMAGAAEEAHGGRPEGAQHALASTSAAVGNGGRDSRQLTAALRTSLQARPLLPHHTGPGCLVRLLPTCTVRSGARS